MSLRTSVPSIVMAALVAIVVWPQAALGQGPPLLPHADLERARAYAPILWLADGEPFYPSLPHPYAFDGVDNDNDGRRDLDDPDEISLSLRLPRLSDRLAELAVSFRNKDGPEPRILYKVEEFPLANEAALDAIQFWFYYVADLGTNPHEGDSEHAFVFVNKARSWSRDGSRQFDVGAVRAVVGAGHTDETANNILATGSMQSPTGVMPVELPKHMPLLVELGKHATAPDLTMDGRFNVNMDANVFRQAAWGSRDAFGLDFIELLGDYSEGYSRPRNPRDAIFERHAFDPANIVAYQEVFRGVEQFKGNRTYRFLPVKDLEEIFAILKNTKDSSDDDSRKRLVEHLKRHAECLWPLGKNGEPFRLPESFDLGEAQFAAFLHWLDASDSHVRIWEKRDFKAPNDVFKTYLYPRLELGFGTLWSQDKPEGQVQGAMLRVAEFSVGTQPFLNDSSLELYANFRAKTTSLYDFGVTYRYFRGGFGGPYFGLGWRGEQRRGTADASPEERLRISRNHGEAADNVSRRFERHVGIDLGYALSWNVSRLKAMRTLNRLTLGAMVGLRSELFAENLPAVEHAFNPDLPRRTRFQIKVTAHVGLVGPRHPLKR